MLELESKCDYGHDEIVVRPEHRLAKGFLNVVLLVAWLVGGISVASGVFVGRLAASRAESYVFLFLWLCASGLLVLPLIWTILGAQVVTLHGMELAIEHRIGPMRIGRRKAFRIADIHAMRVEDRRYRVKGKEVMTQVIAFDYLGEKQDLVSGLSNQRAESLLHGPLRKLIQHGARSADTKPPPANGDGSSGGFRGGGAC